MKRTAVMLLFVFSLVLSLPAAAQDIEAWTCPEGYEGQTLSVYNWSIYIAPETIPTFEEACGVTVQYDIYESNEALLARLQQGNPGYDIAIPSDYMVDIMIDEELLEPIDPEMIPNLENVVAEFLDPPYDPGNAYSVPYQWGTFGIGYHVDRVDGEVASWADLFEHDGPVSWLEDVRGMLGVGMLMQGYDPNSTDVDEIGESRDFLIDNGSNVVSITVSGGQQLLSSGNVDMAVVYNGNIYQLNADCECEDYVYVIPEEGTAIWMDNLVIPADAPNPELAMVFMDYILHPLVGADISNYLAYGSPNGVAIDEGLILEELLSDPGTYPTDEVLEKLYFTATNAEAEQDYNDAWDAIKVLVGE